MDYHKIYHKIVQRGKNRMLTEYKENHHIVPRCLGGNDSEDNLVSLTPEEHYLCHLLLIKMYPNNIKLVQAAMFMTASTNFIKRNNKMYGWLRRRWADYMRGPNNPQKLNPRTGTNHHYHNKKRPPSDEWLTVEGRKKIADKMTGEKNPCFGVKPWNNPRATDYTRSIWARADEIYNYWITNNKPSYCKLHRFIHNKMYDSVSIGPFMSMVKYFRDGWIPEQDIEWKELKL